MSHKLVSLYIGDGEYYTRTDADAVIAELKKKLKNSRNARKYWRKEYLIEYKECCSQKYKRCLAMAEMCKARYDEEDAKVNGCGASWEYISKQMKYWERRQWRWEALAEKFKHNNSTAQRAKDTNHV